MDVFVAVVDAWN